MFTSRAPDHLAFVGRHLAALLGKMSVDDAFGELERACGKEYASDLERLRALFEARPSVPETLGPGPFATLARMLSEPGVAKDRLFPAFIEYLQQTGVTMKTYWAGVTSLIWYFVVLFVVAGTIVWIYIAHVLPRYDVLFVGLGAELPPFTRTVFSLSSNGLPLLVAIAATIVGLSIWFNVTFQRRVQQLAPAPHWPEWLPLLGRLRETWNYGLYINLARLLSASGMPVAPAVDLARELAGMSEDAGYQRLLDSERTFGDNRPLTELAIAARLDQLDLEIEMQADAHIGVLSEQLVTVRERLTLFTKLILFVLIGALVVGMYLPIFQLGSVL